MNFENKLIPGVFIKRYKRFFVDIKMNKKIITAHCPNTGSMHGLLKKKNKVWFTKSNNSKIKLKYTLQIIESNGSKVGINTHLTNKIVLDALRNNEIETIKVADLKYSDYFPNVDNYLNKNLPILKKLPVLKKIIRYLFRTHNFIIKIRYYFKLKKYFK